ncbi:MAG: hypothetical protein ABSB76_39790 [Streptosporangiaceae bacterium]|jgi:hypothetical protein
MIEAEALTKGLHAALLLSAVLVLAAGLFTVVDLRGRASPRAPHAGTEVLPSR